MGFINALWVHMRQLLTFKHQGDGLPERWSPAVAFILVLTMIGSQIYFISIPESSKQRVEQIVAEQMGQPVPEQSEADRQIAQQSSSTQQSNTNERSQISKPQRAIGVLMGQLISFIIIGLVGGVGLLCAFALIELPLDLLRSVWMMTQMPMIGLIFIWEWIAIGVIAWRIIKKKHPMMG